MQQKVAIFLALLLLMGGSSCRVTTLPMRHIFFPPKVQLAEDNMELLAQAITKDIGIKVTTQDNLGLYSFVADWRHVPYRFGANGMRGTDCSGFVWRLYETVYDLNIGRTSAADLMSKSKRVEKKDLKEGDLVFFNINNRRGGRASHVGVYLRDNLFVHAATRSGVTISSMNDPYYKRHYLGAGRFDI